MYHCHHSEPVGDHVRHSWMAKSGNGDVSSRPMRLCELGSSAVVYISDLPASASRTEKTNIP